MDFGAGGMGTGTSAHDRFELAADSGGAGRERERGSLRTRSGGGMRWGRRVPEAGSGAVGDVSSGGTVAGGWWGARGRGR